MKLLIVSILCCVVIDANSRKVRLTTNEIIKPGEAPYSVSILFDGEHLRGGSLMSQRRILTAALCIYDFTKNKYDMARIKIVLGTTLLPGGILTDVDRIVYHKKFRYSGNDLRTYLQADIGAIRMSSPVKLSENISIIELPDRNTEVSTGTELLITVFGASSLEGLTSSVLKKLKSYTVDTEICEKLWEPMPIAHSMLCANNAPGFGICGGVSGGPVTIDGKVLVGIASAVHGSGCGHGSGVPDLIIKVLYYLNFIYREKFTLD